LAAELAAGSAAVTIKLLGNQKFALLFASSNRKFQVINLLKAAAFQPCLPA